MMALAVLPRRPVRRDLQHFVAEAGHFGNAAGVVNDRAIGVVGDDHADDGEHADGGGGDAHHRVVRADGLAQLVGDQGGEADAQQRRQAGEQAVAEAVEDGESRAVLAGLGHLGHRLFVIAGKEVRSDADDDAGNPCPACAAAPEAEVELRDGHSDGGQHGEDATVM